MIQDRYLTKYIQSDLIEKMVFLGGPRQVGKTTLARDLIGSTYNNAAYFNWDSRLDRNIIMKSQWPGDAEIIILDEIHKYRNWKSHLKGEYDTLKNRFRFLVTGSARLDQYRKGSDSLQGRYHYYRLHPFTLAELEKDMTCPTIFNELNFDKKSRNDSFLQLEEYGGYPEPFLKADPRFLRRWHNEKNSRLFREDIRDIENVRDISNMQLLSDMLVDRAGSRLSLNSLREDISVSHRAVTSWIDILESFYYCFRIYPYSGNNYRSLKKEPKLYLWDWSEIYDKGHRFENMVASHLLKLVHFLHDYEGYKASLHYLRNTEKREVDFLITINSKPWFAIEVKLNETDVSPHIKYFKEKINIPFTYQLVHKTGVDFFSSDTRIISADKFLTALI